MKKISLMILLFSGTYFVARAQHDPSDQIISGNWDMIGNIEFKTVKSTEMYAIFGNDIKKYSNKPFELEGYIVPIKDGMKQSKFMLSTLPINQCFFCGQNGIPMMVMIELTEPIKFTYQPITIKGILKLSTSNVINVPPVSLVSGKAL
ncbi:hypothetical protein ACVWYN_002824 [Pedobacter sp. UYP24]